MHQHDRELSARKRPGLRVLLVSAFLLAGQVATAASASAGGCLNG